MAQVSDCAVKRPFNLTELDDIILDCSNGIYDACHNICHRNYNEMYRLDFRWPLQFALPVYGLFFPILLVFLISSNILVVLVLSKQHMVSPTNTVLLYMAVADLFVGLVPAPFTIFYFTLGYYRFTSSQEVWWCYMGHYLMDVLPPVCHNVAIWLTVLLAFQRFMFVQYPVFAKKVCTIRNVRYASLIIVCMSILSNILKYYEVTFTMFRGCPVVHENNATKIGNESVFCINRNTFVPDSMGEYYFPIFLWTRAVCFVLVPSVLLVVLNVLLIYRLRKSKERRHRLLCQNRSKEYKRQSDGNNTSLMLVLVVSIFLVVNLPQAAFFTTMCIDSAVGLDLKFFGSEYASLFVMVCNMLIMATYPINFAIYCSTSAQFRDTFKSIFFQRFSAKLTHERLRSHISTNTYCRSRSVSL